MNERIYKSTSFQVVKELVLLIVACAFLAFILHFFVKDYINAIVVAVVFVLKTGNCMLRLQMIPLQ